MWADLAPEILLAIFEHLHLEDLIRARRVSAQWLSVVACMRTLPQCVKETGDCSFVCCDEKFIGIASAVPQLRTLDVRKGVQSLSSMGLSKLPSLSSLSTLRLTDHSSLRDDHLLSMVHLTSLTALDLSWCSGISDRGMAPLMAALSSLRSIILRGCRRVTDVSVEAVCATRLSSVALGCCPLLTGRTLDALATHTCITELWLNHCHLRACDDIGALSTLRRLRELDLSGNSVTAASLTRLTTITTLTDLQLAFCVGLTDACVESIVRAQPALANVGLQGLDMLTDVTLQACASRPLLRHLDACGCTRLTGAAIRALSRGPAAHRMRSLSLGRCTEIASEAFDMLSHMSDLTNLDLHCCIALRAPAAFLSSRCSLFLSNVYIHACVSLYT